MLAQKISFSQPAPSPAAEAGSERPEFDPVPRDHNFVKTSFSQGETRSMSARHGSRDIKLTPNFHLSRRLSCLLDLRAEECCLLPELCTRVSLSLRW